MSAELYEQTIYRYLRFKSRHKRWTATSGRNVAVRLGLPAFALHGLNQMAGIGSFGPADSQLSQRRMAHRYAKRNWYHADTKHFYRWGGRYHCSADRTLRQGKYPPRRTQPIERYEGS